MRCDFLLALRELVDLGFFVPGAGLPARLETKVAGKPQPASRQIT